MKIAIVSRGVPTKDDPLNGIFELDQAKALVGQGVEVAIVAIDFRSMDYKRKYGLLKYDLNGIKVFELSLPLGVYRRAIPMLQRLFLMAFRAMLKSFGQPDVIHAHFYSIAAIASIAKEKYGIPFFITEHSSKLNKPANQISALDKQLASNAFLYCDKLICVSETLRKNILQNFGRDSIVIPNMVDNESFHYLEQVKKDLPFVFVSVGNLIPIKAFDKLIESFSRVKETAKLCIIGDGPERENLQNQIYKLQLCSQVELLGRLNRYEINNVFQKSHVFVLPSQSETFGVSYIEAMYAGLPVIATRCGGPESFVDESNGVLVPVNDVEALAKAMQTMRDDFDIFDPRQISANCIARFSPEVIAKQTIKTYSL